jgi:protoporphyrinogen/coproporphyrinogen III oxidase
MDGLTSTDTDIVVIGAGLGGLFAAAEMRRRGMEALIVDGARRPGGVARTVRDGGYLLEPGVGALPHGNAALDPILMSVGIELPEPTPGSSTRYLFDGSRLVAAGPSPRVLRRSILPARHVPRLLAEPLVRPRPHPGDESLESLMMRRLGVGAGRLAAALMAGGVFAGSADRLSAASAFPEVVAVERRFGSLARGALRARRAGAPTRRTVAPAGGMDGVADALAGTPGAGFMPSFPVSAVHPAAGGRWVVDGPQRIIARRVVVTLGAEAASPILPTPVAGLLRGIRSAPVAVTWLGGPEGRFPVPGGFGYLSTPASGAVAIGCLFESSTTPSRSPEGHSLVKVISGGDRHPDLLEWDDERLVESVRAEVARALGADVEPAYSRVLRHRPGIPQYDIGHGDRLARIDEALAGLPGLMLGGWSYRGVGAAHLAVDAVRLADAMMGGESP